MSGRARSEEDLHRAEMFLESLIVGAKSERRAESYRRLAEVLREKVGRGDSNFDIKSVAAECARNRGPAEQTIRNSTGEEFRRLIAAYAAVCGGRVRRRVSAIDYSRELTQRLASSIADAQLRSEMVLIMAEHRSFKRQIDILRSHTSKGMVISLHNETFGGAAIPNGGEEPLLTEVELNAIRRFLATFNSNGWAIAADGRLLTETGREIGSFGFVSGLRKIVNRGPTML